MSQQGPGGYGGGGYGGGPPPGGYGGGPPPPGGYGGAPPPGGGYGGYPGQPYGAPGGPPQGMPGQPPVKKKSNTMLWVGLGCGGLLLVSGVLAVAGYMFIAQKANEQLEVIGAIADGGITAPTATGGDCAKAAACCKAMVQKSGTAAGTEANCDSFLKLPDSACAQPLEMYRKSAGVLGVKCE